MSSMPSKKRFLSNLKWERVKNLIENKALALLSCKTGGLQFFIEKTKFIERILLSQSHSIFFRHH